MQILTHHNLYVGMIEALKMIIEEEEYTDRAIEKIFKQNRLWGSRDRGFVAEMIYDMVRWKRKINFVSGNTLKKRHYWDFIGAWVLMNDGELPDYEEFQGLKRDKILAAMRQAYKHPAIQHSVSDELNAIGLAQLGEDWYAELEELNIPASAIIRVNSLRATAQDVKAEFRDLDIEIVKLKRYEDAYALREKANIFKTDAFQKGWFEMQDASSQLVAPFCEVEPGMRVADTCAGAGGKTLHLAALMQNKGQIMAMDIYQNKLNELKRRAKRDGAHNIQTKLIDSKQLKRWKGSFDRVLIDAPCTGSGVLKRNPDAKYKINNEFLNNVKATQAEVLDNYSKLMKDDGLLMYVTCSIFPAENDKQIEHFLQNHPEFELKEEKKIWPSETGFDGFYMAKLGKK
ncbi:methyltransferase domain-containing protein [Flavobacteriaceae bacterium Ap0902]|nr:methyltransferase domain-containing protein [Flavobacteriaceae bacterium Ap0902]